MNDTRLPKIVYFLMLAMGVLQWVRAYPQLPDRMASHFDLYGRANGWQPKEAFFVVMAVVIAITGAIGFLVPRIIAAAPAELLNLPRKDYWLAPERREETLRFLQTQMEWFGCGVLFILLYAASQAIDANLPDHGPFGTQGMLYVLLAFVLLTTAGTVHLLLHFYRASPPNSPSR
jgi:uncharacterized membrane protein